MEQELKFQEFSIKEYIFIIKLHLKKIIFIMLLGFSIGLYYSLITPPKYIAVASLLIKEQPGAGMIMNITGSNNPDNISNAIQMAKSRTISRETVKTLWPRYKNNLDLFGSYPFYPRGRRLRKFINKIINLGEEVDIEPRMIYNESYSEEIGNKFAKIIESKIRVEHVNNTDIIKISYSSVWAAEAQLIVNTLIQVYKDFEKKIKSEETINAVDFLEKLVKEQSILLIKAEEEMAAFQSKEQIYDENAQSSLFSNKIIDLENKILERKAKIRIGHEKIKFFKSQLTKEEAIISEKIQNTLNMQVEVLRTSISKLESEKLVSSAKYGERHEAVGEIDIRIQVLKKQLDDKILKLLSKGLDTDDPMITRQNLITQIMDLEIQEYMLDFEIQESKDLIRIFKDKLDLMPPKRLEYYKLQRNKNRILQNYNLFRSQLEDVKISVATKVGDVQILDLSSLPDNNVNDNNREVFYGLLFGLAAGFGLAFLIEFLDSSVKTIYDIEKHNLSVLGVIPAMNESKIKSNFIMKSFIPKDDKINNPGIRQLITLDNPKSPISEAYRSLRTTLLYSESKNKIKSIIVSSAGPGDGKTTTVANLAITLANMGKRTILIDTDLRRPVVNKVFNIDKSPGITDYLSGYTEDFSELIVKSEIKNLFIVPSGIAPPNPSELLGSPRLAELIKKLENEWDMVLFDSPPLVAVTDATVISKEIDKIIIVVKVGQTENKAFEHTINVLKNISAPLGGIILNAVTERHNYGGYYYYYQYYHYYGSDTKSV